MKFQLHDVIKRKLSEIVLEGINKISQSSNSDLESIYNSWSEPPQWDMGQTAFPCFNLAKSLKSSPAKIAQQLEKEICLNPIFEKCQSFGPYLNFFLNFEEIAKLILPQIDSGQFFQIKLTENAPRTMIEYSQPNTHKELHVGHMRNLALGQSLSLLFKYSDYPILTVTYPGDVGTHVAKCLWYLKYHFKGEIPAENPGAFLGEIYSMAHNRLEDEKGSEQEAKNRLILGNILKELKEKSGEYYQLWQETRIWSIEQMKKLYKWANVQFDHWYFESEVDEPSLKLAQDYYKKGIFIESDGAIGVDLSEANLGFCMMIKSDGNGLYATKDIELARRKFEEHNIEKNIYIVDVRQSHHFSQVFKVLEKIGFKQAKDCYHLAYDFVELPDGAMSSRKGNVIPVEKLILNMQALIKNNYLKHYEGSWSLEEIDHTAQIVALGAINYGMLRIDPQRKIVFDMDEWLKLDGESGPYLQYAYARIQSLCKKLTHLSSNPLKSMIFTETEEKKLLYKLSQFNSVVLQSAQNYRPSQLCSYLYDLAKLFNSFYAECPVGQAKSEDVARCRYLLAKSTGEILKQGLGLLGIPAPEKM